MTSDAVEVSTRWLRRHRGAFQHAATVAAVAVMLFPVYWTVITALKGSQAQIFAEPPTFYPPHPDWDVLWRTIRDSGRPLVNSIVISGLATLITAAVCIPAAYALAKLGIPERMTHVVLLVLLIVQALPTNAGRSSVRDGSQTQSAQPILDDRPAGLDVRRTIQHAYITSIYVEPSQFTPRGSAGGWCDGATGVYTDNAP